MYSADVLIPRVFATPSLQVDVSLSGCRVFEAVLTEGKENKRSQQVLREHGLHRLMQTQGQTFFGVVFASITDSLHVRS